MASLRSNFLVLFTSFCSLAASAELFASDGPSVDMDHNGNAVSAWITHSDGNIIVQANTKVGSKWNTPTTISTPSSNIDYPKVAVMTNGTDISAVAIWSQQNEDGVMALFAAELPNSGYGWSPATQISSNTETVVGSKQYYVKLTDSGYAVTLWSAYDKSGNEYIRSSTSQIGADNIWSAEDYVSGP